MSEPEHSSKIRRILASGKPVWGFRIVEEGGVERVRHPDDDDEECPFIVPPDTRDEKQDAPTRDLVNERVVVIREESLRLVALRVVWLIAGVFALGMICMLIAEIWKPPAPTDPIERVLLPTLTGLLGVLGGLYASTR